MAADMEGGSVNMHPSQYPADVPADEDDKIHITCCLTDRSYCGIDCTALPADDDSDNYCIPCKSQFDADPNHCPSGFDCLDDPT
jgi:hypothetical protein